MTLREIFRIITTPRIYRFAVLVLTLAALTLTLTTLAAITVTKDVSSSGTITTVTITTSPNIGVYSDSACTTSLSSINWGSLTAGASTARTVYVKNTGTAVMTLNLATSNWSPVVANSYLSINWDKQGQTLAAGQSTPAIITLAVSPSVTGITTFSNTITLSGNG